VHGETNIYLVGPMGSGKTAVGRHIAKTLGLEFFDTDMEIQRRTGVDIPYIFEKEGEAGFRARERDVIAELTSLRGVVVATGGGAVLSDENRDRLAATGVVVHLDTSVDEQLRRTGRTKHRPLLLVDDPRRVLEELREIRAPLYAEIADISIDTTGRRVRGVVTTIERLLKERGFLPLQKR
jgi:shikimate kinase